MFRTAVSAILLWLLLTGTSSGAPLTEQERQRLIAHLNMTEGWLVDEVSGLSPAQLEYRRAPGTWTILEVVDHLLVVGPIYWQDLQTALKGPGGRRSTASDADILWYGIDRSNRETAIPSEVPKGLKDFRAGLEAHRKLHARLIEYVRTTKDDLRGHMVERQSCDAYQWALLISTHEQRHILQIREIKSDAGFMALALLPAAASAQNTGPYRGPIIDVHLHAQTRESLAQPAPNPATGQMSPKTTEEHMTRSLEIMKERNVVLGIVSGPSVAAVEPWDAAAPERIMKGIGLDDPSTFMKPQDLDRLFLEKRLDAFGEVAAQYAGYSPSDPAFDAYWAVAAKHGVPVGIHTGGAPPATPYTCCPKFRLKLGDPLLLEDMLVKYPTLKVYVMHAGGFFPQNALMLMTMYPHVYVDISTLSWTPIAGDLLEPFLNEVKRRRMLDRVMFGSDQMRWPEAIALAIDRVNRLDFLTVEEKAHIFYDNAAKFLGLPPEEIARHHR